MPKGKNPKGAIVYWIEAESGQLRSQMMEPYHLPHKGSTYETEVRFKYAVNPVEMATIYLSRAGNEWEKGEVERLRAKSQAMQAERREKEMRTETDRTTSTHGSDGADQSSVDGF